MENKGEANCMNCLFCSEHYPSLVDTCDIDQHIIKDADIEKCEKFETYWEE